MHESMHDYPYTARSPVKFGFMKAPTAAAGRAAGSSRNPRTVGVRGAYQWAAGATLPQIALPPWDSRRRLCCEGMRDPHPLMP